MAESDTRSHIKNSDKPLSRLTHDARLAIIAAVASGRTQVQVAKDFGVHRNTVYELCKSVKALDHPANPLQKDWKMALTHKATDAITRGLDDASDRYRAADIGVKVLTGLGEFQSGNNLKVDAVSNVVIQWGRSDEPQQPPIDVTPVEPQ